MSILTFVVLPLALVVLGVPIFLVLLIATAAGILYLGIGSLHAIHIAIFGSFDSFPLLAIPLFIFAGDLMARGGIAERLIALIMSIIGGIRGSLPVATIASASAFGAMSGSSVACVAAVGRLTLPALERNGYGRSFSVSLIAATGVIDVIIPPSIPMIIYGITAQQSVTQLFLAGIVPGLIIAASLSIYVTARAMIKNSARGDRPRMSVIIPAFKRSIWALFAPVLVLGGIYGGAFTPTEAAGVACVYAIIVSALIHGELSLADIWRIALDSGQLIAQLMVLVAAAGAYGWLVTAGGIGAQLVSYVAELQLETWLLLLVINFLLLIIGSVLEPPAALLILVPLLMPIVLQAGIDPIHFGLVVTVNLAIGMFLPPFGLNLFAAHALFQTPLPELYRGVIPFLFIYIAILLLLTYIPAITLAPLAWMR